MAWTIDYTDTARRQLRKFDKQTARRILDFMDERVADFKTHALQARHSLARSVASGAIASVTVVSSVTFRMPMYASSWCNLAIGVRFTDKFRMPN